MFNHISSNVGAYYISLSVQVLSTIFSLVIPQHRLVLSCGHIKIVSTLSYGDKIEISIL
jgi:hypothetical protein